MTHQTENFDLNDIYLQFELLVHSHFKTHSHLAKGHGSARESVDVIPCSYLRNTSLEIFLRSV